MFNYRKLPPIPTNEEICEKGKTIGLFDIDILSEQDDWKICTYWGGFRKSYFEKFSKFVSNHLCSKNKKGL